MFGSPTRVPFSSIAILWKYGPKGSPLKRSQNTHQNLCCGEVYIFVGRQTFPLSLEPWTQLFIRILSTKTFLQCSNFIPKGLSFNRTTPGHILRNRQRTLWRKRRFWFLSGRRVPQTLNPIENIYGIIKRKVERTGKKTVAEWKGEIQKIWEEINHDILRSLAESMPRRLRMVIEAKGETIKY